MWYNAGRYLKINKERSEFIEQFQIQIGITCTSSNFKNDTFNFKFMESGEFRTDNSSMAVEREGMCHTVTLSYLLCREKYSPN